MGQTSGLKATTFAIKFTPGPEQKPWDATKGYASIFGFTYVSNTIFMNFNGTDYCGSRIHAIANHEMAPEAFHPHYFQKIQLKNVKQDALLHLTGPNPA